MLKSEIIKIQPSAFIIKANIFIRFIKVGGILHLMTMMGIFLFWIGLQNSIFFFENNQIKYALLWLFVCCYGFTLPFFAEFDAYGRYQNYKQIKDTLYKYGFDTRLVAPFMNSKCQRDAVIVAATDLNLKEEVKELFYTNGYRWYHVLPNAFLKNPFILFKKVFWERILFTKFYHLQNFYW
ncbi:hypothetical protein MNBD_BACTEROID02-1146 [hydrothermal vent metagenome]|uniref:Uncharacterized protein n=1 Tax=hydrothermal vent metagenome TaxID=652676 RepID=A0A3B0RNC1_9ZZZZ